MKKFLTLLAFVAFTGTVSAQSTATDAPKAEATETMKSCAKGEAAKAGCCASKAKASAQASAAATIDPVAPAPGRHGAKAEAGTAATTAAAPGSKAAGCCAGKAKAGAGCAGKAHAANTEPPASEE
ncbi:MAG: hypothetical protein RBT71_01825 [Flavobacteriales bacterium]|jgi:hypothetical protein|nr:hypothetical protein [Flavobacteriales bacterium]